MRTLPALFLAAALALPAAALAAPTEEEVAAINAARADYQRGKRAIDRLDWKEAIAALEAAAGKDPGNADVQNLLGFAQRASGNMDAAFRHYARALELNPGHRGAHEYLGRAYLMADKPEKAVEVLEKLERLCMGACRERDTLRKAIEEYPWPPQSRTTARGY